MDAQLREQAQWLGNELSHMHQKSLKRAQTSTSSHYLYNTLIVIFSAIINFTAYILVTLVICLVYVLKHQHPQFLHLRKGSTGRSVRSTDEEHRAQLEHLHIRKCEQETRDEAWFARAYRMRGDRIDLEGENARKFSGDFFKSEHGG